MSSTIDQGLSWQSINTAPRNGSRFLLSDGSRVTVGSFDTHDEEWLDDTIPDYMDDSISPTHWMPLPEPPR